MENEKNLVVSRKGYTFLSKNPNINLETAFLRGISISVNRKTIRDIGSPLYKQVIKNVPKKGHGDPWILNMNDYLIWDREIDMITINNIEAIRIDYTDSNLTIWVAEDKLRFLIKMKIIKDVSIFRKIAEDIVDNFLEDDSFKIIIPFKPILNGLDIKTKSKLGPYKKKHKIT